MNKRMASIIAATSIAAILTLPSSYAEARRFGDRADRADLSASQIIDRADARIAILKADLRLTADQAKNWSGFEAALHDVAVNRAKSRASYRDPRIGRSISEPVVAAPTGDEDADVAARNARAGAIAPPDDILALQRESDALAVQSAALKQIADAGRPLYDSLDDRQRQRLVQFVHDDMRAYQADDWRALRR